MLLRVPVRGRPSSAGRTYRLAAGEATDDGAAGGGPRPPCPPGAGACVGETWAGSAELSIYQPPNEEVLPFQPSLVLGGYWFDLGWPHFVPPVDIRDYLEGR